VTVDTFYCKTFRSASHFMLTLQHMFPASNTSPEYSLLYYWFWLY